MARKRTKKRGARQRQRALVPAPRRVQNSAAISMAATQVCGFTNPFCDAAKGAKWPDGAAPRSVTFSTVTPNGYSTDVNGNLSTLFIADAEVYTCAGTVAPTTGDATFSAMLPFPGHSFVANAKYRITSVGFKISCLSTRMNTQGMLRLRLLSPLYPKTLLAVPTATPFADEVLDVPLSRLIEKDIFVNLSASGLNARVFQTSGDALYTNLAEFSDLGNGLEWQSLVMSVVGGQPSTSCVEVTCFRHYEKITPDDDPFMLFATPPKKANQSFIDTAVNTARSVGGFIEGAAKTVDSIYHSKAVQLLLNLHPETRGPNQAVMAARHTVPLLVD